VPIRIIFITGQDAEVRQRAMDGGAVDVLDKPVSVEALLEGMSAALGVRQA
jgi:FixJ family two-component response regulator